MSTEFNPQFAKFYDYFMRQLVLVVPPSVNIPEAYEKGTDEQQKFVQNLALFFTSFFKVGPAMSIELLRQTAAHRRRRWEGGMAALLPDACSVRLWGSGLVVGRPSAGLTPAFPCRKSGRLRFLWPGWHKQVAVSWALKQAFSQSTSCNMARVPWAHYACGLYLLLCVNALMLCPCCSDARAFMRPSEEQWPRQLCRRRRGKRLMSQAQPACWRAGCS